MPNLLKTLTMKKLTLFMIFSVFSLTSCSKDEIEVIGLEISGTNSLNGIYMLDKANTKGLKYVNADDNTERIITYLADNGKDMWGLMKNNILYYKIEQNGVYPPESDWECGIGVDKDKFKCELIID